MEQWEGERRHRCADTVVHFADQKEVADQERAFHRRRGNGVGLDEDQADKMGGEDGEKRGFCPFAEGVFMKAAVVGFNLLDFNSYLLIPKR